MSKTGLTSRRRASGAAAHAGCSPASHGGHAGLIGDLVGDGGVGLEVVVERDHDSQTASVDLMPSASRSPIHDLRQHLANGGPPAAQLCAIAERKVLHSGGDRQTILVEVVRHAGRPGLGSSAPCHPHSRPAVEPPSTWRTARICSRRRSTSSGGHGPGTRAWRP
jgi:hypothetical protein